MCIRDSFKDTSPEVTFFLKLSTSKFNEPSSLTSRAMPVSYTHLRAHETSLHIEKPFLEIDRNILISKIISEISNNLNYFLEKGFKAFKKDFDKRNILKNKKVLVSNFSSSDCIALDVNEDGSLNLLVDNFKQKVTSGEVSLKIQK